MIINVALYLFCLTVYFAYQRYIYKCPFKIAFINAYICSLINSQNLNWALTTFYEYFIYRWKDKTIKWSTSKTLSLLDLVPSSIRFNSLKRFIFLANSAFFLLGMPFILQCLGNCLGELVWWLTTKGIFTQKGIKLIFQSPCCLHRSCPRLWDWTYMCVCMVIVFVKFSEVRYFNCSWLRRCSLLLQISFCHSPHTRW